MAKTNKYAVTLYKNIFSDVWEYQTYYIDEVNGEEACARAWVWYGGKSSIVVACAKIKQN